uniref:Uncharacterized protein n=1 Tax=Glossina palpalis gambiensis TaxID=67801 RepID=A0A1B0ASZ7_9MUSC
MCSYHIPGNITIIFCKAYQCCTIFHRKNILVCTAYLVFMFNNSYYVSYIYIYIYIYMCVCIYILICYTQYMKRNRSTYILYLSISLAKLHIHFTANIVYTESHVSWKCAFKVHF